MMAAPSKEFAQQIADELVEHINEYHSLEEVWDNDLDRQIHKWYAAAKDVFPKRPYFSPSSADACPQELYYKAKRASKDKMKRQPHQARWQKIGTSIGDIMQREILSMERNFEKQIGRPFPFRFEKNADGTPVFEEFAKRNVPITHKGKDFHLYGTTDGIMEYFAADGEIIRVGLEVKSKQTTSARTSAYSMQVPEESHVKQCVSYAEMYGVDMFVVMYVNASKKTWVYRGDDFEKTPDIRAFGIHVTDEDKTELFDKFVDVLDSVENNEPLPFDPEKWLFNPYKTLIAKAMSDEDFDKLVEQGHRMKHSSLPAFRKRDLAEVIEFISDTREGKL